MNTIFYEQPVNELIRACLRLEHVFSQLEHTLNQSEIWDTRASLSSLIEIVNILDRPDLRSKLTTELGRHKKNLESLQSNSNVDNTKLADLLDHLDTMLQSLHGNNGKFAQNLRSNDFLSHLRQRLASPGGASDFDAPAFHYWLHQPFTERYAHMEVWMQELNDIRMATELLLSLTRQSTPPIQKTAFAGFYQQALDPQSPCQLIRIGIPAESKYYPEISAGRHRLIVRFLKPGVDERPTQSSQDVEFDLYSCVI